MKFRLVAVIALGLLASGCSRPDHARQVLADNGFTEIHITGWSPFSCSDDDMFSTGFRARGVNGRFVTGTVCSGFLFKGATLRFN